jgi:uncharacterized alpha-E superfamily protein
VISRVADHCFWLGRYLDRAESTARLLQVTRALAFDAEMPTKECWRPVVTVSGQYPDFVERFGDEAAGNGDMVQRYMTWASENPVSIRNSIWGAREGARSIREVLSLDIWQAINELYLWFVGEDAQRHDAARPAHGHPVAGRAARAHRADGAHPGHAPLRPG